MLDIKFIRENADKVKQAVKNKKATANIDHLLSLDDQRRKLTVKIEDLRAKRNEITQKLKAGKDDELIKQSKSLKDELGKFELEFEEIDKQWTSEMLKVPNIPWPDVPVGKDERENEIVFTWGAPRKFDFEPKDHVQLGKELNMIDIESAAKVAGSRFGYILGAAAQLQFALMNFVFETLTNEKILKKIAGSVEKGYSHKPFIPIVPPVMIKPDVYVKTSRLSEEDKEERYYLQQDDLYLIGSAEHSLVSKHMDEVLKEEQLPLRYIGYSTSFRRESGSYGKDVKGILRVHQFDKLEMESFTSAENSFKEHLFLIAIEEYILQALELPYRKLLKCTADIGMPNARGVDLEVWVPSQKTYRETHTADLMTDFQARRLNIKVKTGKDNELVHTNDATAVAMPRTLIAILENNQEADGSIKVPKVLQKYTGFSEIKK
ncbi:MAG: serine--tRNA ligase [Candidatus Doudnabacteria bacterium]